MIAEVVPGRFGSTSRDLTVGSKVHGSGCHTSSI